MVKVEEKVREKGGEKHGRLFNESPRVQK